jgi:hypothetical protein
MRRQTTATDGPLPLYTPATFGTYFDTGALRTVGGDPVGAGPNGTVLENPRTVTPAPPLAVYGGLKVRF